MISGKKQMILARGQASPAVTSDRFRFTIKCWKKLNDSPLSRGFFYCVACLEGLGFNSCALLFLPVQTEIKLRLSERGASACICFAGSNEINRQLSEWGASACVCRRTRITSVSSIWKRNFSEISLLQINYPNKQKLLKIINSTCNIWLKILFQSEFILL